MSIDNAFRNAFTKFNEGLDQMRSESPDDPATEVVVDFFKSLIDTVSPLCEPSGGTTDINMSYPFFHNTPEDLQTFAKIRLLWEASKKTELYMYRWYKPGFLSNSRVRELRLTDIDRFMLKMMGYSVCGIKSLKIDVEDNIPKGLTGPNLIIAKDIAGKKLTADENIQLNALINEIVSNIKWRMICN